MLPYFSILGIAFPVPAMTILIGIWLGLSLAEKYATQHKISSDHLYNMVFVGMAAGLLGARLAYAARYSDAFIANPASLISLNFGLLDIGGGVAIGLLTALIYGQRKAMPLWSTLDALTPALTVVGLAVALANLASGQAYGTISDLPWTIELWEASRHPTQIYEAVAALAILIYLWPTRQPAKTTSGTIFLTFIAASSLARLFFEAFRADSPVMLGSLRTPQLAAWLIAAAALWGLGQRRITADE